MATTERPESRSLGDRLYDALFHITLCSEDSGSSINVAFKYQYHCGIII